MHDAALGHAASLNDDERRAAYRRAWFGFIAMMFGNFMAILDIQIVASSLNEIQAGLSASADELTWVQTSYLIAEVIAIPMSGYMSRAFSTRLYFTICATGFTLASLGCAMSWNIGSMVVFRVLQGFLGGGMIPTTLGALFTMFPAEKRTLPVVLVGMISTIAPALGPTVGGYITASLSWHWLFLINVIPGVIVATSVWSLVRIDRPDWSLLRGIDFIGLLSMALFLGSLEFVLDEGPRHDWLDDDLVRPVFYLMLVAGVAFFWRAFTSKNPIVDLRTFGNRNFATGCVIAFVVGVLLYGIVYIVPTFFGRVRGYNSEQIGHVMMLTGIAMFFTAPLVGRLQSKIDLRLLLAYGLCMVAIGTWINGHLTAQSDFWDFALPQILRGHGFIFCIITMTGLGMGTLRQEEIKNASGLLNLMRNFGGAIGLALINTMMQYGNALHWSHLSSSVRLSREPVREMLSQGAGASGGADQQIMTLHNISQTVAQQAAVMTFNDLFHVLALLVLGAAALLLFAKKPHAAVPADAGGH